MPVCVTTCVCSLPVLLRSQDHHASWTNHENCHHLHIAAAAAVVLVDLVVVIVLVVAVVVVAVDVVDQLLLVVLVDVQLEAVASTDWAQVVVAAAAAAVSAVSGVTFVVCVRVVWCPCVLCMMQWKSVGSSTQMVVKQFDF